jgi:type I restriction enzyme, S subunit
MEILTEKIDLNNLDKSNWETFKFGEIAQKISKTIDPNETTLETYVGLEHIDAEDLHIRRKGSPDDVKGGKLRCYPGDIIFGKRRAYQRKAAIVDFDGICSAHAFVLRANSEVIDSKLFPFFLHSNQFMHRMVDISVGGLSPTINWGDLKHQEFLLPPKDQQAQLAKLLWVMDEVIEREKEVLEISESLFRSDLKQTFFNENLKYKRLKSEVELSTGKRMKGGGLKEGEVLSIGGENINDSGQLIFEKNKYISEDFFNEMKNGVILKEDILMMKDGAKTGKVAFVENEIKAATNEHLFIVRSKTEELNQKFLFYFLLSDYGQQQIRNFFHGIIGGVTRDDVHDLKIPIYNSNSQSNEVDKFDQYTNSIESLRSNISASQSLQKSLINQIF